MAAEVTIEEPAVLLRITKVNPDELSATCLKDWTRGTWRLNPVRARKALYAFSIYKGIIKQVYKISDWVEAGTVRYPCQGDVVTKGRWEFEGKVAPEKIREKYLGKSVKRYFSKGDANPIHYVQI